MFAGNQPSYSPLWGSFTDWPCYFLKNQKRPPNPMHSLVFGAGWTWIQIPAWPLA